MRWELVYQLRLTNSVHTPDPRTYDGIQPWLCAALEATGQTPRQIALAIGLSKNAIAELLAHPERVPGRPTLDKLAAYFTVDPAELRAMRPKRADRVALGHRQMARLGPERSAEIAERGRASKREKMAARTPEERSGITRATGAASRRRNSSEDFARMGQRGEQVMKDRGYKHSAEGRAAMSERVRRTGQSSAGARAAHAKYGTDHPGLLALRELVASPEHRDKMRLHGMITQVLLKVRRSGQVGLVERVDKQAAAQRRQLREPDQRGRPATLLRDRDIAIAAAIMADEYGTTAREIGELLGKRSHQIAGTQWQTPAREVWHLIRLGRVLLGNDPDAIISQ